MRIPISKADWPGSFNSTSKYIGRHWPKGKLKLSESREKTAQLMGYNSVHDVHQELLDVIPNKFYSTQTMASSMAVKAVLLYELDPVESYRFFSSIPWSNLEVWNMTSEYKTQLMEANGKLFIMDEYHSFINYSTPALIASAFTKGQIPPYEFTISENGEMFHRSTFERLLELVEPKVEDIVECGHEMSVEEYFNKYILPLAHCPVDEMIMRLHPDEPKYWLTPTGVHILDADKDRYVLLNKPLNAFYPGAYNPQHLAQVIKKLFTLQIIPDAPTQCLVSSDIYSISQDEMMPFGVNGTFTFNEQVFYRREKLKDYSVINTDFLAYLLQKLKPARGFTIPESIIPATELASINKSLTIDRRIMKSNPDGVTALMDLGISNVLSSLYGETYYGDEQLSNDDSFDISDRYFESDDEQMEALNEVIRYTAYCETLGKEVLIYMPELKPYYSELFIGHGFHERYKIEKDDDDWSLENNELATQAERHLDFFVFLIADHLCEVFNEYAKGIAYRGVCWLLTAVSTKHIKVDEFKEGFLQLISIHRMLNDDKSVFTEMEKYCTVSKLNLDDRYLNHGKPYKPTLKKDVDKRNESFNKLFRLGRKLNSAVTTVDQSLHDF